MLTETKYTYSSIADILTLELGLSRSRLKELFQRYDFGSTKLSIDKLPNLRAKYPNIIYTPTFVDPKSDIYVKITCVIGTPIEIDSLYIALNSADNLLADLMLAVKELLSPTTKCFHPLQAKLLMIKEFYKLKEQHKDSNLELYCSSSSVDSIFIRKSTNFCFTDSFIIECKSMLDGLLEKFSAALKFVFSHEYVLGLFYNSWFPVRLVAINNNRLETLVTEVRIDSSTYIVKLLTEDEISNVCLGTEVITDKEILSKIEAKLNLSK